MTLPNIRSTGPAVARVGASPGLAVALAAGFALLFATDTFATVGDRSPDNLWVETDADVIPDAAPSVEPGEAYRAYRLDDTRLERLLKSVALENSIEERTDPRTMTLPLPDGTFALFRIAESPVLSEELALQNVGIRTYLGRGVDDRALSARFDRTPLGFHALVRLADDYVIIEPASTQDGIRYLSYRKSVVEAPEGVRCTVSDEQGSVAPSEILAPPSGAVLRTYRMAISATGEYTTLYGGRANAIMQITTTVNQLNLIYDPEVAIRFNLVCFAIAPTGAGDRYANPGNVDDALIDLNTTVLNDTCGTANYDIGHLFHFTGAGTGYSGRGHFGVVCDNANKGDGASTGVNPASGLFLIDLFAHEVGHQFDARHIFNSASATLCTGARSGNDAYEISSGTTIMSYAFSGCAEDIPGTAIPFFNSHSFDQITNFRDAGGACGTTANTGNTPPTVSAGPDHTIPRNTPFILTATGNDTDGDALTFLWEQHDRGPSSPPLNGGVQGPLFRGFNPTASASRTFPNLAGLLAGSTPWEFLPTIDRTLTFRCTARGANSGGVNHDTVVLTVLGDPFVVTSPNGGEMLRAGCTVPVTWTVGGGSVAANVNILLSTDGGNTFPTTLAANATNDGSQDVLLPCIAFDTQCRVKVEAVGNVFFDISDNNFTIFSESPDIDLPPIADTEVNALCVVEVPFTAIIEDDCRIDAGDVVIEATSTDGRSTVSIPFLILTQEAPDRVRATGAVSVSALTACPAEVRLRIVATDECGFSSTHNELFLVEDNIPPQIALDLSREFLWPPNHRLADIHVDVTFTDNCPGASYVLSSITSDEPENGLGDGDTAPDIVGAAFGTPDTDFQLRSERSGKGDGRVYTIVYTAADGCGNSTPAIAQVRVAHDQSGHAMVAFGLDGTGAAIDPEAATVVLVVPSMEKSPDGSETVAAEVGLRPDPNTGPTTEAPRFFDARLIAAAEAQIGNAKAVVTAERVESVDANGDKLLDRVLVFPTDAILALLEQSAAEDGPLGLHYVTRMGESFIVPDLLALGTASGLTASVLEPFASGANASDGAGGAAIDASSDASDTGTTSTGVEGAGSLPRVTRLSGIRPNPFAFSTTIAFDVARPSRVRIAVYDPLGRLVRTVEDGVRNAGQHVVVWDGRDGDGARARAGIYFIRFEGDGVGHSRKAVLMQ